jgi:hypothetical protein
MSRRPSFSGIIISHLGNIAGRQPEQENSLVYLKAALTAGWHVMAEVTFQNGAFFLPTAKGAVYAPPSFFSGQRVWCRATDPTTLDALCNVGAHCFSGGFGPYVLTSHQFFWTLPDNQLVDRSIAVYPELGSPDWLNAAEPAGICSNEPAAYL